MQNLLFVCLLLLIIGNECVMMQKKYMVTPKSFTNIRNSTSSKLYTIDLPEDNEKGHYYKTKPLLLVLKGTRRQIGYDYAALLHNETTDTLNAFMSSVFPKESDRMMLLTFIDYCWDNFLKKNTPETFLEELAGMRSYYEKNGFPKGPNNFTADVVSQRFYTLANMPADPENIISMLEQELEKGWPDWLKYAVNYIIKLLEKLIHSCDAYGVWGSRTKGNVLYTSRNLDYQSNTGINRHKLVTFYDIDETPALKGKIYSTLGFAFGMGALAGMNQEGVTVSEMNLDNSKVTFDGVPFPLRLRMVLENGNSLETAMLTWNTTHNTNSFNFLIGSASDAEKGQNAAYALETIMDFTAQYGANSNIERDATYNCVKDECHRWTNQTGIVHIGHPLPEAVWRSNHAFHPRIMETQEPLFNNTVFRYNLMYTLFSELEKAGQPIDDDAAVGIVATLGTKGVNYYSCEQDFTGDNVMSISYAPRTKTPGYLYIAWESLSGPEWRPAACSPFVKIDFAHWI